MAYIAPASSTEALAFLREARPQVVAGCTDFYPSLKRGRGGSDILDVTRIEGFRGIAEADGGWRIGAATSWTDVARADLPASFDALKLAAREVGSVQIQNRGTIAGNLCNASPAADGVPPLLAMEAGVELASASGTRILALPDFISGPGKTELRPDELVSAILVPSISSRAGSGFAKLGGRAFMTISIAMAAAVAEAVDGRIREVRIAVGSCSPVARRLPALEARLRGCAVSDLERMQFGAEGDFAPLSPIADVRGSAEYRLDAVGELCRRALAMACRGRRADA